MCEQVIMNEEFENEKAIKHRKRLIGKYSVDRYVGSSSQGFFGLRLKYAGGNISNFIIVLIAQFRYFQIQCKTIDITTRLRGINPTNSIVYSWSLMLTKFY